MALSWLRKGCPSDWHTATLVARMACSALMVSCGESRRVIFYVSNRDVACDEAGMAGSAWMVSCRGIQRHIDTSLVASTAIQGTACFEARMVCSATMRQHAHCRTRRCHTKQHTPHQSRTTSTWTSYIEQLMPCTCASLACDRSDSGLALAAARMVCHWLLGICISLDCGAGGADSKSVSHQQQMPAGVGHTHKAAVQNVVARKSLSALVAQHDTTTLAASCTSDAT